jgi:hypothetical protein
LKRKRPLEPRLIEAYCARHDRNAVLRAYNRASYWDERVKIATWWDSTLADLAKG